MLTTSSRAMFCICVLSCLCQTLRWNRRALTSVPAPRWHSSKSKWSCRLSALSTHNNKVYTTQHKKKHNRLPLMSRYQVENETAVYRRGDEHFGYLDVKLSAAARGMAGRSTASDHDVWMVPSSMFTRIKSSVSCSRKGTFTVRAHKL